VILGVSETGRFDRKLRKKKVMNGLFSTGQGKKILGESVAIFRHENSYNQDMRDLENVKWCQFFS
jgi:hypothetical protein